MNKSFILFSACSLLQSTTKHFSVNSDCHKSNLKAINLIKEELSEEACSGRDRLMLYAELYINYEMNLAPLNQLTFTSWFNGATIVLFFILDCNHVWHSGYARISAGIYIVLYIEVNGKCSI